MGCAVYMAVTCLCLLAVQEERLKKKEQKRAEKARQRGVSVLFSDLIMAYVCVCIYIDIYIYVCVLGGWGGKH